MATNLELVKETRNLAHKMPYSLGTELADALEALIDREKRLMETLQYFETEARRFAEMYPQSSDGRNTFVIFADKIAEKMKLIK